MKLSFDFSLTALTRLRGGAFFNLKNKGVAMTYKNKKKHLANVWDHSHSLCLLNTAEIRKQLTDADVQSCQNVASGWACNTHTLYSLADLIRVRGLSLYFNLY